MKISAYAAGVAVVLCLVVAGCSSSDGPGGSSPSEKPSPTVTTEAPPAPPELPAAATKKTAAGAEAFVKYYWAVVRYSELSGTTDLLRTLQTGGCSGCDKGIEGLEEIFDDGAVFSKVNAEAKTQSSPLIRSGTSAYVVVMTTVRYRGGTLTYTDGSGREEHQEPRTTEFDIIPLWEAASTGWRIHQLGPHQR